MKQKLLEMAPHQSILCSLTLQKEKEALATNWQGSYELLDLSTYHKGIFTTLINLHFLTVISQSRLLKGELMQEGNSQRELQVSTIINRCFVFNKYSLIVVFT